MPPAGGAEHGPDTRLHGFIGPWYSRRSINIRMCICTFNNGCYRHRSPIRGIRCPMEPKYQRKTFNYNFPLEDHCHVLDLSDSCYVDINTVYIYECPDYSQHNIKIIYGLLIVKLS